MQQTTRVNKFLTYAPTIKLITANWTIFELINEKTNSTKAEYFFYDNKSLTRERTPTPIGISKIKYQSMDYEINSEYRVYSDTMCLLLEEIEIYGKNERHATMITVFDLENLNVKRVEAVAFPESWYVMGLTNNILFVQSNGNDYPTMCIDINTGRDIIVDTVLLETAEQNMISIPTDSCFYNTHIFKDQVIYGIFYDDAQFITKDGVMLNTNAKKAFLIDSDTYVTKYLDYDHWSLTIGNSEKFRKFEMRCGSIEGAFKLNIEDELPGMIYFLVDRGIDREFEIHQLNLSIEPEREPIDHVELFLNDF